ncbi:MAG: hypothetical protein ABEL04_08310 [Salinibacter sp.]|uniref:hypothetical protein n=1 Tax=Salinibacter sp. TaxID=2065818 RepID=UPI0035D4ED02
MADRSSAGPSTSLLLLVSTLLMGAAILPPGAAAQSSPSAIPDGEARREALRSDVSSPGLLFQSIGVGTGARLDDEPAAWHETTEGYAARVGSSAGAASLQIGTTHALAAALRLSTHPHPSRHESAGARLWHTALSPVHVRTPTGAHAPNLPNIAGTYASTLAQTRGERGRWAPGRALRSTAVSLGSDMGARAAQELIEIISQGG